jgi:hypothetical protein
MKVLMILVVAAIVFGCTSSQDPVTPLDHRSLPIDTSWSASPVWDDGKAEVAVYEAVRVVYGKRRTYEFTMITVKEMFNRAFNVKTDSYERNDLFTVMKVNLSARIDTDVYPYHYLTSMFFPRTSPHDVYKITSGSQEWCGNTFKRIQRTDSTYGYAFDSYWDNEGAGIRTLPLNVWFEDQLFYTLRALDIAKAKTPFTVRVLPTMITNRAALDTATPATFTLTSDMIDPSSLGTISSIVEQECWRVTMKRTDGVEAQWWFSKDPQHILLRFHHSDGRSLRLKTLNRSAYWTTE